MGVIIDIGVKCSGENLTVRMFDGVSVHSGSSVSWDLWWLGIEVICVWIRVDHDVHLV